MRQPIMMDESDATVRSALLVQCVLKLKTATVEISEQLIF